LPTRIKCDLSTRYSMRVLTLGVIFLESYFTVLLLRFIFKVCWNSFIGCYCSGVIEPNSTKPKPVSNRASTAYPFWSNPGANPIGFENICPLFDLTLIYLIIQSIKAAYINLRIKLNIHLWEESDIPKPQKQRLHDVRTL
jgi:hypothetical protein